MVPGVKIGFPGSLIILNLRLILGGGVSTCAFIVQGVPKCVPAFKLLYDPPVKQRLRVRPLFWPILRQRFFVGSVRVFPWCARPAHGGSRSGWHAACPSTCPAPPRSRFGGADYELLERARHGTLGPSDSEATLLQLGRPALRMSSKHEVAFIFTPHDGPE